MLSLAPFQGITDVVYRNIFKKHFRGIEKYYTPFFTGIQKDNSKSLRGEEISPDFNDVNTVVPQILSNTYLIAGVSVQLPRKIFLKEESEYGFQENQ